MFSVKFLTNVPFRAYCATVLNDVSDTKTSSTSQYTSPTSDTVLRKEFLLISSCGIDSVTTRLLGYVLEEQLA
jgi:hypothetical protein